jgi:16S rRNA G527 N7-methylase RsmG
MLNWCHHLPGATGHFYALKGVRPDDEIRSTAVFLAGCCAKPNGMNRDKSTPFARLLPPDHRCHHLPGATGHFYALKGVRPDDEIAALPAGFAIEKIVE